MYSSFSMARARISGLPVVLAGHQGERGRQHDRLRAAQGQDAKELGEAQVIADREADRNAIDLGDGDLVAGSDGRRFLVLGNAIEHDVIHVDLAVAGDDLTRGIDDEGGVVDARVARTLLVDAAPVNVDPVAPRALSKQRR